MQLSCFLLTSLVGVRSPCGLHFPQLLMEFSIFARVYEPSVFPSGMLCSMIFAWLFLFVLFVCFLVELYFSHV